MLESYFPDSMSKSEKKSRFDDAKLYTYKGKESEEVYNFLTENKKANQPKQPLVEVLRESLRKAGVDVVDEEQMMHHDDYGYSYLSAEQLGKVDFVLVSHGFEVSRKDVFDSDDSAIKILASTAMTMYSLGQLPIGCDDIEVKANFNLYDVGDLEKPIDEVSFSVLGRKCGSFAWLGMPDANDKDGLNDAIKLLAEKEVQHLGLMPHWGDMDTYFSNKDKEIEEIERIKREAAERKRQQEMAQKRRNTKKQAVSSYIASRPDLSQALGQVVQIGSEKKAVDSFIRKNGFGRLCETGSNNTFYQSKSCLSEWEVVRRQASSHYSSLDSTYKKQRDWFAGLFGQNASVAAAVVDDRAARTPSDKTVKQQYAPIEQQLIRITESEARSERAESRRREQQQMADFMNHIQTTFERTNRMLDRNMAQTHRVVNQAYASQRVRDVSSSSGYRVRSAPAMRDLNKELEEIDRSFDVSASSGSGGMKSGGVATAGAGSSGKSAYRVCGGPTTVPAMNQVFDVRGLNSGKASPDYQCPAGGKPVVAGAYNLETGNITWLNRPPTYKQEPVRGENGRPNGARVSWDAYRYVCLCSNSGSGTPAGGYQQ